MDRLKELELKIEELTSKIDALTKNSSEKQFLDLFLQIERCTNFEELQDVSTTIGKMDLPKMESLVFALAARIRQNTIVSELMDDAIFELQQLILPEYEEIYH